MDDPLIENLIQFFPFFLVIPCFRSQLSIKYWSVRHHAECWSLDTAVTLTQEHPHKQVTPGLIYADWVDFPYSAPLFLCYRHVLQISNLRNVSPVWTFEHTFAIWLLLCWTIFCVLGVLGKQQWVPGLSAAQVTEVIVKPYSCVYSPKSKSSAQGPLHAWEEPGRFHNILHCFNVSFQKGSSQ